MKEIEVLVLGKVFLGKNTGNSVANPFPRKKRASEPVDCLFFRKNRLAIASTGLFLKKMGCRRSFRCFFSEKWTIDGKYKMV